jgi:hypothetical protein
VWLGSSVVDGLAAVIDEHMDARRPGLRDRLPGGTRTLLGPHGPEPDFMVGPVRVVGMSGGDGKLLVLGWEMRGEGGFGEEHRWFNPSSAWWGSANWTKTVAGKLPKRR